MDALFFVGLVAFVVSSYLISTAKTRCARDHARRRSILLAANFPKAVPDTEHSSSREPRTKPIKNEAVDRALWRIVELTIRDFVEWWFIPSVGTDPEFPNDVRDMLDYSFSRLAHAVSAVDWPYFVAQRVLATFKEVIRIQRYTERQLKEEMGQAFTDADDQQRTKLLRRAILAGYKLHPAARCSSADQLHYIRKVAAVLVSQLLRPKDYRCDALRSMCREILSCDIIHPNMAYFEPHWLNNSIVTALKVAGSHVDQKEGTGGVGAAEAFDAEADDDEGHTATADAECNPPATAESTTESPACFPDSQLTDKILARNQERKRRQERARLVKKMPGAQMRLDVQRHTRDYMARIRQSERRQKGPQVATATVHGPPMAPRTAPPLEPTPATGVLEAAHNLSATIPPTTTDEDPVDAAEGAPSEQEPATPFAGVDASALTPADDGAQDSEVVQQVLAASNTQTASEWDIRIIRAVTKYDPKPYVSYRMRVRNTQYCWVVHKRYSQFTELHHALKHRVKTLDAVLPKKQFFGNLDHKFVTARQAELQKYLNAMLRNRGVSQTEEFLMFFMPDSDSPLEPVQTQWGEAKTESPIKKYKSEDVLAALQAPSLGSPDAAITPIKESPEAEAEMTTAAETTEQTVEAEEQKRGLRKLFHRLRVKKRSSQNQDSSVDTLQVQTDRDTADESDADGFHTPRSTRLSPAADSSHVSDGERKDRPNSLSAWVSQSTPNSPAGHLDSDADRQPRTPPSLLRSATAGTGELAGNVTAEEDLLQFEELTHTEKYATLGGTPKRKRAKRHKRANTTLYRRRSGSWQQNKMITQPLYDLVNEIFALNERGFVRGKITWLAQRVVETVLDKSVSKWFSTTVMSLTSTKSVVGWIEYVTNMVWPNGVFITPGQPPTDDEIAQCRAQAKQSLLSVDTGTLQTLLGKRPTQKGLERLFQFCQLEPLTFHLAYTSLDALVVELFPDVRPLMQD